MKYEIQFLLIKDNLRSGKMLHISYMSDSIFKSYIELTYFSYVDIL